MGNCVRRSEFSDEVDVVQLGTLTDEFHQNWIAPKRMDGAAVVICRGDRIIYRQHFGDHSPDSMYALYSLTKVFTTVACMQLEEQGLLRLDDPVSDYLESFEGKHRLFGSNACTETITVRQCLNHTSGLHLYNGMVHPSKFWTKLQWREAAKLTELAGKNLAGYVDEFLARTPLLFAPGTRFHYQDGHSVVARIVEKVSNKSFAFYVLENITRPLGMVDTGFLPSDAQKARLARTRCDRRDLDWPAVKGTCASCFAGCLPWRPSVPDTVTTKAKIRGGSGLKGTISDMTRFNQMILNGGTLDGVRILAESSVRQMSSNSLPVGAELCAPFAFGGIESTSGSFGAKPGSQKRYNVLNSYPGQSFGLGVAIVEDAVKAGLHPAAKGTCWWQGLASTYWAYNRQTDIGCLVFAQNLTCFSRQQALADVVNMAHRTLGGS